MAQQRTPYLDPLAVSKLKNIELKARMIVEGFITGLHRSPYHGFSVEFAEHRPYNSGEPLRNIDWKVFGKTGKLFTKRYEEETNLRCHLVLDVSDSMRYPIGAKDRLSKLEYCAYLAGALGHLLLNQRDAVGLSMFDERLREYIPPKAKATWLRHILLQLESVVQTASQFQHRTATPAVLHEVAQKIGRRGLVILMTDLFTSTDPDELFPALQHLRHQQHEVLIFHVLEDRTELNFDFPNQPMILQDLESGDKIRVQPGQIREKYVARMQEYREYIKHKSRELNIDFVEIDVSTPYDKALMDFLVKRNRMLK